MADRYAVSLYRLPKGYRVSEVRYNASPCPHGIATLDPAAQEHRIHVSLAEASGTVMATVTDGKDPVPGAVVLLVPEPIDGAVLYTHSYRQAQADANGRAVISELLPGVYRLVAWREGTLWADDALLRDRVANGQEVRVSARQGATIQVRVR